VAVPLDLLRLLLLRAYLAPLVIRPPQAQWEVQRYQLLKFQVTLTLMGRSEPVLVLMLGMALYQATLQVQQVAAVRTITHYQ